MFLMYVRNKLYDYGIIRAKQTRKPVVSVGNLTTGGAGKTPLTLWIAEYIISAGKNPAIISRGYGRKSQGSIVVCDGMNILESVEQSGDELYMISENLLSKYPGQFVTAAGNDRFSAAEMVTEKYSPDIILLDDAFQHRRISRDLNILLINAEEFHNDRLSHLLTIPSGNLREPRSGIGRAEIIVINFKSGSDYSVPFAEESGKDIMNMRYRSEYFVDTENTILTDIESEVIVFSGLADNASFLESLKSLPVVIKDVISFRDHHDYSERDTALMMRNYTGEETFVTTQKDFIKARMLKCFNQKCRLVYLKSRIELSNSELLTNKIDKLLT